MRRVKVLVVMIIIIILIGLYSLSNLLISKSGDWVVQDNENTVETEEETVASTSSEKETIAEDIVLSNGERLYENRGNSNLMLLEGAENYERICNQIVNLSGEIFNQISEDVKTDVGNICYYRIVENPTLDLENFPREGYNRFFIENSLTIIGLYNGTTAIAVYNYECGSSKELVVIDYSDSEVRNGMDDFISLGQKISLSANKEQIKVVPMLDYEVLYVKG